jgi:hypothetical protein
MNHYGISAIHWNANLGDIDEVLLHKFVQHEPAGAPIIGRGEPTWCSDVVSLIRGGDAVWVLRSVGAGRYKNTDHVGVNVRRGRQAYLYSCMKDGSPTTALADLPRYQKPDDLPSKPPGVGSSVDRARPS